MKKRMLSLLLCLCMLIGLLPTTVFGADDGVKVSAVKTEADIPSDYQGIIMKWEPVSKIGTGTVSGYAVRLGLYNVPASSAFAVGLEYDTDVLQLARSNNGGNATAWTQALSPATYVAEMLTDPDDGGGYVGVSVTDTNTNMGFLTASGFALDNTNQYEVAYRVNTDLSGVMADIKGLSQDGNNTMYASPTGIPVYYATVFFKLKSGVTEDKITYDTIKLVANNDNYDVGAATYTNDGAVTKGALMIGFKEEDKSGSITITTKTGDVTVSGIDVELHQNSSTGAIVKTDKTGSDGSVIFTGVEPGTYVAVAKPGAGTGSDGNPYRLTANQNTGSLVITNKDVLSRDISTGFEKIEEHYDFKVKAQNATNNGLTLTGATITAAPQFAEPTVAGDTASVSVSTPGSVTLEISGLQGYQPTTGALTLAGSDSSISGLTASSDNITVAQEGSDWVATMTLAKTTTKVEIPLPVPSTEDGTVNKDQAGKMEVTFTPESESAKAELGGPVKRPVQVTADSDGTVTGITVGEDLPDGKYTMTIGGDGFEDTEVPVTVVTTYDESGTPTRVVNVGGDAVLGEDGEVETVTGGVTATNKSKDESGNGSVDLSGNETGTTIVEGGKIDLSDEANPVLPEAGTDGATNVEGGLLDSDAVTGEDGIIGDKLQPGMDVDPMYDITVDWLKNGDAYTGVTATVVLKNTAAHNGTFGMYFDKDVFGDPLQTTNNGITVAPGTGLNLSHGKTSGPEINVGDATSDGYVYFEWGAVQSGTELPSGTTVATITLPIRSNLLTGNAFMDDLDDHSIYTMKYTLTKDGKATIDELTANLTDAFQEMDANERQEILDAAVATIWRAVEYKPLDVKNGTGYGLEHGFYLADSKADRGGFYRFYRGTDAEAGGGRDIRMKFRLPDEFLQNTRVDFWASEPDTNDGIEGAQIYIVKDDPTVLKTYADRLAAGMTQDQLDADENLKGVIRLDTDQNGYAHLVQENGTYYFAVYEKSHWAYPNGTTTTDEDHLLYAAYTVLDHVVTPLTVTVTEDGADYSVTVPYNSDAINPQMAAKTYHEVALEGDGAANLSVRPTIAYNAVRYYFTITPDAGYTWKTDTEMTDVAAALNKDGNAALYIANRNASTEEELFRSLEEGADAPTALKVEWDAARKMFYIDGDMEGNKIGGAPIGIETWGSDPDQITLNALRAGDIVLKLPEEVQEMIEKATYTITATAGVGGSIQAIRPTSVTTPGEGDPASEFTTPDGYDFGLLTAATEAQVIVEKLKNGLTTSQTYEFKPTGTNKIAKVIINGVEQTITDQQKENGFSYTFKNVAADQTIYVMFADASGTPLSDPYISVTVGDNGNAAVYKNATTSEDNKLGDVPGGQSGSFTTPEGDKIVLTITPDKILPAAADGSEKYIIDQLLVNGDDWNDSVHLTDNGDGSFTVTLPTDAADPDKTLKKGDAISVVVTFKPENGDSTHVIVTSSIDYGFGVLSPMGTNVYAIGDTPKFALTPDAGWTVRSTDDHKAIMLDGVDRSTGVVKDAGTGEFSYTLPALTGNAELVVCFAEETVTISGRIQVQAVTQTNAEKAKLTFTRAANAATGTDETTVIAYSEAEVKTLSIGTTPSQIMAFTAEVPVGNWTLLVEKHGYLTYTITGFEVADSDEHIHFGASAADCDHASSLDSCTATAKPIILTPGDAAGDGLSVAVNDTATVTAGWLSTAAGSIAATKGNLNEDTYGVDTVDMGLVTGSLYKVRTKTSYTKFCGLTQLNKAV